MSKPPNPDRIWCEVCQDWIGRDELRFWNGDDAHHWLCPGCDSDMLPVTSPDQEYDEWRATLASSETDEDD
jgi:Zn finger protein HypA/HybF involved in hydrogenase expression